MAVRVLEQLKAPVFPQWLFKALVFFFPQSLTTKGQSGKTPLHTMIENACHFSLEKLERVHADAVYLIDKGPAALMLANDWGDLPLHTALKSNGLLGKYNDEFIGALLNGFEDAARVPFHDDKLPLEFAIRTRAAYPVVKLLLNTYPEAVLKRTESKDENGNNQFLHETPKLIHDYRVYQLEDTLKNQFDALVIRDALTPLFHQFQLDGSGPDHIILDFAGISDDATSGGERTK